MMGVAAALLALNIDAADGQSDRETRRFGQRGASGKPIMAIVSLDDQRITIYDAKGKLLQAPVSTGSPGYETPAGIFSIVQKKEHHHSNLYQDGEMPFMQRITWTGIALHAGNLPGHPASHGCIRLPMAFAQQLFDMTELGMRIVIVRDDMRPSDISHPLLFKSKPVPRELALAGQRSAKLGPAAPDGVIIPGSARHLQILQSAAATTAEELEAAGSRQRQAQTAAARAAAQATAAARLVRAAEGGVANGERALKEAERRLEAATSPQAQQQAEATKVKAQARFDQLQAQLQAARLQEQAKREAAERAGEETKAAAVSREVAAQAADEAARKTLPVSVFISRKTQRLYVRKGNHPIFEGPVTIRNSQAPIGTFVFTALDHLGSSGEVRWSVVGMYRNPTSTDSTEQPRRGKARSDGAAPTDAAAAGAALDRITMAQEALDIITDVVLPGSSLIISDEGPSRETGKDTDFVVVMSNEPQGALKIRQREPAAGPTDLFDRRRPSREPPFFWQW
jgi:L,D-transpeptidase catalytic domain